MIKDLKDNWFVAVVCGVALLVMVHSINKDNERFCTSEVTANSHC